jgi:hypothetical protein
VSYRQQVARLMGICSWLFKAAPSYRITAEQSEWHRMFDRTRIELRTVCVALVILRRAVLDLVAGRKMPKQKRPG